MIPVDKSLKCRKLFAYRDEVLKQLPMGKLEQKIDKFLADNGVKYHRRWFIKLGSNTRNKKRFAVSFFLCDSHIALDMVNDDSPMEYYDMERTKKVLLDYDSKQTRLDVIIPINENLSWREVKKQLQIFISR